MIKLVPFDDLSGRHFINNCAGLSLRPEEIRAGYTEAYPDKACFVNPEQRADDGTLYRVCLYPADVAFDAEDHPELWGQVEEIRLPVIYEEDA